MAMRYIEKPQTCQNPPPKSRKLLQAKFLSLLPSNQKEILKKGMSWTKQKPKGPTFKVQSIAIANPLYIHFIHQWPPSTSCWCLVFNTWYKDVWKKGLSQRTFTPPPHTAVLTWPQVSFLECWRGGGEAAGGGTTLGTIANYCVRAINSTA